MASIIEARRAILLNTPHLSQASGAVASFNTDFVAPLKSCVVDIDPVQSGSGNPSPSNFRPISGWTGVNVQRMGKNFIDVSSIVQGNFDGAVLVNNCVIPEYLPIKGGSNYVWSTQVSNISGRYVRFYDSGKTHLSSSNVNLYGVGNKTFTAPSNACYIRVMWYKTTGISPSDITADQIELGSTATTYTPYTGTTYPITWQSSAGTVYGGRLDVTTGVLTVDRQLVNVSEILNAYSTSVGGWNTVKLNNYVISSTNPTFIAEQWNAHTWSGRGVGDVVADNNKRLFFLTPDNTNRPEGKVCLELETPITYQLTPTQVKTLVGQNNIFADTGNTSVKFWTH